MTKELARFLLDCVLYKRDCMIVPDTDFMRNAMDAAVFLTPIANQ